MNFERNKAKTYKRSKSGADGAADTFSKGGLDRYKKHSDKPYIEQSDKQAVKNKERRTALLTGKSKLNTIDSMKKGLQKAKIKLGGKVLTGAKRFANKVGTNTMLGKVASSVGSVGRKVAQSGGTGRRALNNKLTGK